MSDRPAPTPAPDGPPRKRRRLRYALHTSHVLALLVAAGLLLYLLALPAVVRRVVRSSLADLGYPGATFSVRLASLTAVELADVHPAGGEATVIQNVLVRFSPIKVFGGRLRSIQLTGAEVPLTIRDGTVQFGLAIKSSGSGPLPFDRLDVVASTLHVDWEGRQIQLPVQGAVLPVADGSTHVELRTFFQGTSIPIVGTIDSTGTAVDLSASATNLSVAGIRSAVPWALMNYPFQTSGRADVRLAYQLKAGESAARLHVEPKNVWLAAQPGDHQLAVQRVNGSLDVELLPGLQLGNATGTLRAGKVAWDDLAAREIELAVRGQGDAIEFEGTLASEGWRLTSLKGTAAGLTSARLPLKVTAGFHAKGALPHQVTGLLERQGVATGHLGQVSVDGSATFSIARAADSNQPWELAIPSAEITLDPGDISLPEKGLAFAGASARLALSGSLNPAGVSLRVAPDSRVAVAGVRSSAGATLTPVSGTEPMLEVAVIDKPIAFIIRNQSSNDPWHVDLPQLRLSVSKTTVSDPASKTNVEGLEGVLNVGGEYSGRKVDMVALADSWLGFQSAKAGGGDAPLHIDAARFAIMPSTDAMPLFAGPAGQKLAAQIRSTTPISLTAGDTKVSAKDLDVAITVAQSESGAPAVHADVRVDGGAVRQPSWGLADVTAHIPVCWNAPKSASQGSFSVGAVTVGEHALPSVAGTVKVIDKSVSLTASADVAKGATLTADANVQWTPAGMVGRAGARLPSFRLDDDQALGRIWKPAAGLGLTGTFAFDGEVLFNGPLVKPRITASLKDAMLTSKEYDLAIDGASGSVTIDSFDPLSGPGRQRITVEKLRVGKLDLAKGGIEFRVERPDSIHIERTKWGWVGGYVYVYDVRVDPAKPQSLDAVVYADKLDLNQLLGVLASGEATGEGRLYGRLPVQLNWPDVSFGEGFLYATGSGGIAIGTKANVVAGLLDQSDPRFANDPKRMEVKARIIDALRNFSYDTLKMDLLRNKDGGLTASVTVGGKGGTGPTAQELTLTVNVNGIDQALRQALVIRQALDAIGR